MGWMTYHRKPGQTDLEHLQDRLFADTSRKIIAHEVIDGVFYAAVHDPKRDDVYGLVVLMRHSDDPDNNFGYKELPETSEPGYDRAPAHVLDKLTPTDDPGALNWRAACRTNLNTEE